MLPNESKFLSELYQEVYPKLMAYASKVLSLKGFTPSMIPDLAEELIQDTFHTASSPKNMEKVMSSRNPNGWIMNTLKFKIKEFLRQVYSDNQNLLLISSLPGELADPSADKAMADMGYDEAMELIRKTLSPMDFRLFQMVALEHASHRAAAQEFGITVWASQKRLERIRSELRKLFSL